MHSSGQSILYSTLYCVLTGILVGLASTLLLMALIFLLMSTAQANSLDDQNDVIYADLQHSGQGQLLFKGQGPHAGHYLLAPGVATEVRIQISGLIARATVRQTFHNPHTEWMEGIYVFPLPETAAVDHLRMRIGELTIEGQIAEKQQARKQYEQAKASGRKASLVEQERPNVFTTAVANIGPGEQIIIEIEYQQTVAFDNGSFSLRFPMVVAPRYIPGTTKVQGIDGSGWGINTNQVPDAERITPPVLAATDTRRNEVSLTVELDPGLPLQSIDSPYHRIVQQALGEPGEHSWQVKLADESVLANRDFVLEWTPRPGQVPQAALFTEQFDAQQYALLMLTPPQIEAQQGLPREVIYVIDTSGSMAGSSMPQAKQALELALQRLHPGDRFNIIQFNSVTDQLYSVAQEVTPLHLSEARTYIRRLNADGGTEMAAALNAALRNQRNSGYVRQVIFLTDGSVGNEQELFDLIRRQLGQSRLFTVGIGSAPNSHFMRSAAEYGRGTHTYIGKPEELRQKMGLLFEKLEKPALTNISLEWPADEHAESWPRNVPDLYAGEPLLISTRLNQLQGELKVSGRIAGAPWHASLPLSGGRSHAGVHVAWARQRIAGLSSQSSEAASPEALRQAVLDTALSHHLVSQYTSLVAIDTTPSRVRDAVLQSRVVASHLPDGWQAGQVIGRLPQTATSAQLNILLGLLCLSVCLFARRMQRHLLR